MHRSTTHTALRRFAALCPLLCAGALGSGCNLFDDLDAYSEATSSDAGNTTRDAGDDDRDAGPTDQGGVPGCESAQTLCVRLSSFSPHLTQLVGVALVSADGFLRTRALLDPFASDSGGNGSQTADIVLPLAIDENEVPAKGEKSTLHLEIFGDANEDGEYTESGGDHSWKEPLPASGHIEYPHNQLFSALKPRPIGAGGDFHMKFFEMNAHMGALLEVIVIEKSSGRPVGFYRMQAVPSPDFEIVIPDIIDTGGVVYRIEFFADLNGNREYDDFDVDHTWTIESIESNSKGLNAMFTHGTLFTNLDYAGHKFKL
jgi:hypothetical protein